VNVVDSIRATARLQPGHAAVVEGERSVRYDELLARADALADEWRRAGVAPLDRVAFVFPDGIEYVVGSLALLALGATVVPVSPTLMWDEISRVVRELDVRHIVSAPNDLREQALLPVAGDPPSAGGLRASRRGEHYALATRECTGLVLPGYESIAPAFIRFSSGTTGTSKGVVLSHRAILERTDAADRALALTPDDVVLWVLSMSFHFVVTILLFLRRGATIVLAQNPLPGALVTGIRRHQGTFIYASPFHYHTLASSGGLAPGDLARVRLAVSTAMRLPPGVARLTLERLGLRLAEAYGIIEVGLPFVNREAGMDGSLGRPLPDFELRLDAPDDTAAGEILLRGPGMLDAYFSPWRQRDEVLQDGWFRTGDLGRLDAAGRLSIVGRTKLVINFNGMKVFPYEVEDVLLRHPQVAECRVFGEPHATYGQLPCAEVVLRPDADAASAPREIRAFCFQKLAAYKVPKEIRPVAALPRTPSGKVCPT
jgi:long-chain acyl-CoA synthetase